MLTRITRKSKKLCKYLIYFFCNLDIFPRCVRDELVRDVWAAVAGGVEGLVALPPPVGRVGVGGRRSRVGDAGAGHNSCHTRTNGVQVAQLYNIQFAQYNLA